MSSNSQSDVFERNLFFWKIFGIWSGREPSKYYKHYSFVYLFVTFVVYNILLTVNLIYTPRKIEFLIREVIFYFTEVAVMAKVVMIFVMKKKILEAFKILDCEEFQGDDEETKNIINRNKEIYKLGWKFHTILSNVSYSSQVFGSLLVYVFGQNKLELPICQYYFLSEELRQKYFIYWSVYQSFGIYGHMMYNVNIDSFTAGIIMMAIAQLKALNVKLNNFKLDKNMKNKNTNIHDRIQMTKLNRCLKHYDLILKYSSTIQDLLRLAMFVQFGMASAIICVVMCGLTMPTKTETMVCMVIYMFALTMQIFIPTWLGTQLKYEAENLTFAAYNTEWIPRSIPFKKSIILFMQRTNIPIQLDALSMFPLTLDTFVSIMKTAYSLFTLIRSVEDK